MAKKDESSELVPTEKEDQTLTYVKWGLMGIGGIVVLSWVLKLILNPFFLVMALLVGGGGYWLFKKSGGGDESGEPENESSNAASRRQTPKREDRGSSSGDALSEFDRRLAELERLKNDRDRS